MISAIVAIGHNRVIGKGNTLLWHIPDDLKRYKQLTMGHPVVMGRKTFESILQILGKPLPGRINIVITRDPSALARFDLDTKFDVNSQTNNTQVLIVGSLEEGLEKAREIDQDEIFIGGGSQIYEQALPMVDKLYVTLIDDEKEGDAYFPAYENDFPKMTFHEDREHEKLKYKWVDLERE